MVSTCLSDLPATAANMGIVHCAELFQQFDNTLVCARTLFTRPMLEEAVGLLDSRYLLLLRRSHGCFGKVITVVAHFAALTTWLLITVS